MKSYDFTYYHPLSCVSVFSFRAREATRLARIVMVATASCAECRRNGLCQSHLLSLWRSCRVCCDCFRCTNSVKTIPGYRLIRAESVDVGVLGCFGSDIEVIQIQSSKMFSRIFQIYFPGVHDHWHCRLHCNADGH